MPKKLLLTDDLAQQIAQEQDVAATAHERKFEADTIDSLSRNTSSALQAGLEVGWGLTLDQAILNQITVDLYGDHSRVLTDEEKFNIGLDEVKGDVTELTAEILTRRQTQMQSAIQHAKDGWFSAAAVGVGALASVLASPTSVATAGAVGAIVNSTRFVQGVAKITNFGAQMRAGLAATRTAQALSRTAAGKTLTAAGAATGVMYGKTLGKLLDSASAAHGVVNVAELTAVEHLDRQLGLEQNIAPFVPAVFLAPGILSAIGRSLSRNIDDTAKGIKLTIDSDGNLSRKPVAVTDPYDPAIAAARNPQLQLPGAAPRLLTGRGEALVTPSVSRISDQAPFPQAAFIKASGIQNELRQSVEYFARAGYDYPMASIFRWTNDVDELNRIVKSVFPEAPDMVDVRMANKFINAVEGDDRWGQLWSRLTSIQADTIKAMHVNKLGRANKRVPKDTDFLDERPPARLGDDIHTQAAQRGLVDAVYQTGVVGRKAKSAKEALQEYDDAVRAASSKAETELKAKEAAEEAAKQTSKAEPTKKPAAKEKPPVTLEDLAQRSEDAINAFVKCVKG